jgi:hypothetical protein
MLTLPSKETEGMSVEGLKLALGHALRELRVAATGLRDGVRYAASVLAATLRGPECSEWVVSR